MVASARDYWISPIGAFCGLAISEFISLKFLGSSNPWFIAPMGASAVLLFAVPASPLAQPWSIIGGNLVAATVAVTCALFFGHAGWVAAVAAGLAIGIMMRLRCLHPPSGAVALTAVLGGAGVTNLGYQFVFFPVLLNSILLLIVALIFNNLFKRSYPHHAKLAAPVTMDVAITRRDIEAALKQNAETLDISEEDLESILEQAEVIAKARKK